MTIELQGEYGGFTIKNSDSGYDVYQGDSLVKSNITTIKGCEELIDRLNKEPVKRIDVFVLNSWGKKIRQGVATSTVAEYGEDCSFWITYKDGRRGKEHSTYVYLDTPDNRKILEAVFEIEDKVKALEDERKSLLNKMTKATPQDMKLEKGE